MSRLNFGNDSLHFLDIVSIISLPVNMLQFNMLQNFKWCCCFHFITWLL